MAPIDPATIGTALSGINVVKKLTDSVIARSKSKKTHLEMLVRSNKVYIINRGPADATDIKVLINDIPEEADSWNCFVLGDSPFRKSLKNGQETHRLIAPSSDCHRSINYKITWKNEDGSPGKIEEDDFRLF